MTTVLDPGADLIVVQDASFIPQSGKQTCGLGHFFNGCANRAEPGLELSPLAVGDVSRRCAVTLAVAQTPPGKAAARKAKREDGTRREFYKPQLPDQRQRWPAGIRSHGVAGYFAKQKYLAEGVALKLHPLTKLRPDATCLFLYTGPQPQRRGRRRKYDGKGNFHDLPRFEALGTLEEKPHSHLYTAVVWHGSLKRTLRVVGLVNRQESPQPRALVLASTDLGLDGHKLLEYYIARFQIEFLFRDSKQFTGLADCQSRAEPGLDFHCHAALATLTLARAADLQHQTAPGPHVVSMASWKQCQFNEQLLD
jgi:hypothetical protein